MKQVIENTTLNTIYGGTRNLYVSLSQHCLSIQAGYTQFFLIFLFCTGTTCPSHRERRTSWHFARWDKRLLQELRGSRRGFLNMEKESWYSVTDGVHVFSAFITTTVEHAIHVVSLVQFRDSNGTSIEPPPMICGIRSSLGVTEHEARIRPLWTWLEPRLKSAFILCPPPAVSEEGVEVAISVRGSSKRLSVWIPVHYPPVESEGKCCAVCVRPTFGSAISVSKVAEFIAHYRLMGAREFYFYDLEMSDDLKVLLGYMQMKGVDITVVPFKLLVDSTEVHAHGQMAGLYDCMFRSMPKSEYHIHVDIDELMVPLQYSNISALVYGVEATHGGHVVGSIVVRSTYYCAEYPLRPLSLQDRRGPLQTRLFTLHTQYVSFGDSTKYVGRTRTICDAGVHIVRKHCGSFQAVLAPSSMAGVNHYRRCCEFAGANRIKTVEFNLWNISELFRDDTVEERATLIENELDILGLRKVGESLIES
ncbi:hypothetical protein HPB48_022788 [Haemaphysalis longicornis]|uniref:Glycosyltransferase family 92 protein n=1 Tax=Haemaphysalis longicornis TaxID=44386 RepID=A0A9J6FV94_HAELO|nr:hypothetical protein HPB48_022788 [Haemaphysalis longicornis]